MNKLIPFVVLFFICGCATVSGTKNLSRETVESSIIQGKTTKTDVLALLGKPSSKMVTNTSMPTVTVPNAQAIDLSKIMPYETWTYSKVTQRFFTAQSLITGGVSAESEALVISFDKDGIVQSYSMSQF